MVNYRLVRKKNSKRLCISVKEGNVIVTAPYFVLLSDINEFVQKKKQWINEVILKQKEAIEQRKKLNYHPPLSREEIKKITDDAMIKLPPYIKYWTEKLCIYPKKIVISPMTSRWGSARSNGNMTLNSFLIQLPEKLMESVIVHELCHFKEMNHSTSFYNLCEKAMPNYRKYDQEINKIGGKILRQLKGYYE